MATGPIRQGDVLLVPVERIPASATHLLRTGDIILAAGEVTGHHHRIKSKSASESRLGSRRYLSVKRPSNLTHEEHETITVPKGDFEIVQQREYSPTPARQTYVRD